MDLYKLNTSFHLFPSGLLLPHLDIAIISDLHLGSKILFDIKDLINILQAHHVRTLIINGDLKEDFKENTPLEWHDIISFIAQCKKKRIHLSVVKGNHDNYLKTILSKHNIPLHDESLQLGSLLITHGHKNIHIPKNIRTMVIGHEHPAIQLTDEAGLKRNYPCFIIAKHNKQTLIVLPHLKKKSHGTPLNTKTEFLSPILQNAMITRAIVHDNEWFEFPWSDIQKSSIQNNSKTNL